VVRQGLRISQPSYSIKKLEAFYMDERETDVAEGGDSILAFEGFLDSGDRGLLEAIERYNDDDCRSTWLLHGWLLDRRAQAIERFGREIPWRQPPEAREPASQPGTEVEELRAALTQGVAEERPDRDDDAQAVWLLAQLLDYHRREEKPVWWAYFDRLEADEEQLVERDSEAIGGLAEDVRVAPRPLPRPARSLIHTLSFPPQDHKVSPGEYVDPATEKSVNVERVDDGEGLLEIRRATNLRQEPLPRGLIPGGPYKTYEQRGALRRLGRDVVDRGLDADGRYEALRRILRCDPPRTTARSPGGALQDDGFDLEEAKRIVAGLDGSHLFVQGPPGSEEDLQRRAAHLPPARPRRPRRRRLEQPRRDSQPAHRGRALRRRGSPIRRRPQAWPTTSGRSTRSRRCSIQTDPLPPFRARGRARAAKLSRSGLERYPRGA